MALVPGLLKPELQVLGVGREGERDFRRQLVDCPARRLARQTEAGYDDGDARLALA